eukprot:TRINITY_DN75_c0_g1_i1.p1 TRINITY_DN75_c0_g1~~TRINITY_DN75_c0_g1_i1.p1  ORF type:complete len:291 (+),score=97.93 TRINITY_DN75_c0_g1_i1:187-1059(+)
MCIRDRCNMRPCILVALLTLALAHAAAPTASSVCIYNDAAFVLKWHLKDTDSGASSSETSAYPVWQTKCLNVKDAMPSASDGAAVVPVIQAVWGKEITASQNLMFDSINATQISYVCKGTTLDFSCQQQPPPPTAGNVTKKVGDFMLGFAEGLGADIGFADCIQDVNATVHVIESLVDMFEGGINWKSLSTIVKAFELLGELIKDIAEAVNVCVKDAQAFVAKMKDLATALSGDVLSILKVVIDEAVHIFRDRVELTNDCKGTVTSWRGGDFKDAGKDVGDIVGIILNGL